MVGALAAWRATQGIERFDPTIFEAVWDTPLTGELPTELLYRLPEWCCYVPVEPARILVPGLEALQACAPGVGRQYPFGFFNNGPW